MNPTVRAFRLRIALMIGLALLVVVAALFVPPTAQDPAYHAFADARRMLGIPHFWNGWRGVSGIQTV